MAYCLKPLIIKAIEYKADEARIKGNDALFIGDSFVLYKEDYEMARGYVVALCGPQPIGRPAR